MPRITRIDEKGYTYHVLNRANARAQIFDNESDYQLFEQLLEKAKKDFSIDIFAYCIMPNHWHIILSTNEDGALQKSIGWISNTHTRHWHIDKNTVGQGHLYQGRYKSFICQNDDHFLKLVRYVEKNPKKSKLVRRAEQWRWSSAWRKKYGTAKQKGLLSNWLIPMPKNYFLWINQPQSKQEQEIIEMSIKKSAPLGDINWREKIINKFDIQSTIRSVGRPKNGG